MYPRTRYEMTKADLITIINACKPAPAIMLHISPPADPQQRANEAWKALGDKMGFDYMTVRPIDGEPPQFFTAVPSETKLQRETRENAEELLKKQKEIAVLHDEICCLQHRMNTLQCEADAYSESNPATNSNNKTT